MFVSGCKREIRYQNRSANGQFYCKVCDRKFHAELYYNSHMKGKPHAAMLKEKLCDSHLTKNQQPCLVLWYCGKCDNHLKLYRKERAHEVDVTVCFCYECDALNKGIQEMFK